MVKQQLLIATRNPGKQREIKEILAGLPYETLFPEHLGLGERPEEEFLELGNTFEQNARRKAEYFSQLTHLPTVAEDSGIEAFALGGEPGVRSRHFALATENQDEANNYELLRRLAGLPPKRRKARYRCVVVFLPSPHEVGQTFEGSCTGRILDEPKGTGGFGYDPLFFSDQLGKSFGQADPDEKRSASHRGQAFRALIEWLTEHPL